MYLKFDESCYALQYFPLIDNDHFTDRNSIFHVYKSLNIEEQYFLV